MDSLGLEKFTKDIFRNKQRTSTKSGILKSEAVLRFASVLSKFGVNYFQDVSKVISDEMFEKEIMRIPGQTSGLSLGYFFMLSGSNEFIKPDRMVLRFLETALERRVSPGEAKELVTKTVSNLRSSHHNLTPRLLDNEMWKFQRGKPVNKVPIAKTMKPKQRVSFEELLMSQVVQQEALTELLVEKGIFSKEEFQDTVRAVSNEMKKNQRLKTFRKLACH
jgi:hypothetical protein